MKLVSDRTRPEHTGFQLRPHSWRCRTDTQVLQRCPSPHWLASPGNDSELHELLTVEDVAALLEVSRSWVYKNALTRHSANGALRVRKIAYKRFDHGRFASSSSGARRAHEPLCRLTTMDRELAVARRANEEKDCSRMLAGNDSTVAVLWEGRKGVGARWREREIAPDGTIKKRLCYEALGNSPARGWCVLRRKWPSSAQRRPMQAA